MKRTIIIVAQLLCVLAVQAQTVKDLERVGRKRDSVMFVLAEHRTTYSERASERERLTPIIISLESEVNRLHAEYQRLVDAVAQADAKSASTQYENAKNAPKNGQGGEVVIDPKSVYVPDKSKMKRDLVANDYFEQRLSPNDYKSLCETKQRELGVHKAVTKYISQYGELLALHRRYMEVDTQAKADSIAVLFATKSKQLSALDAEIVSKWSALYYNKMYTYDLLMERGGNTAMLDFSATASARADREINENSDIYQSDALVEYFARKRVLTEYELKIASVLSLTTSRDSLNVVMSKLKNRDYRLSKLSLQRRNFINYESVTVKKPTIYTSKNPVPEVKIYDYGVIYRIRLGVFSRRPDISAMRGVVPLFCTKAYHKGLYAYYVGGFRTEQEAKDCVVYLKKLGFKDPIISVWVDGEYYPTIDDMRRAQSLYNIEISGVPTLSDEVKARILSHKSDCTISRIGSTFVVGTFDGKSIADAVATDLAALSAEMVVKVIKKP
ncbi:MAG: hypothetical protein IKA26_04200 [Alistipes sp.]|nr:hypothetical protein [Alistipes sp.]